MDKPVTETRGDSQKYNKGGNNRIQIMLNPGNEPWNEPRVPLIGRDLYT